MFVNEYVQREAFAETTTLRKWLIHTFTNMFLYLNAADAFFPLSLLPGFLDSW